MFVRSSIYQKEWMRRIDAEANLEMANTIISSLTKQVADLKKYMSNQRFNAEEVRYLLRVAHPDRNGGADIATTITQKLLEMRR